MVKVIPIINDHASDNDYYLTALPHKFLNPFVEHIECVASIPRCAVNVMPRIADQMCMCIGRLWANGYHDVAPMKPTCIGHQPWKREKERKRKEKSDEIKTIVITIPDARTHKVTLINARIQTKYINYRLNDDPFAFAFLSIPPPAQTEMLLFLLR